MRDKPKYLVAIVAALALAGCGADDSHAGSSHPKAPTVHPEKCWNVANKGVVGDGRDLGGVCRVDLDGRTCYLTGDGGYDASLWCEEVS